MIQHIKKISADFQLHPFAVQLRGLGQRDIEVRQPRPSERVAARCPISPIRWILHRVEPRRIELINRKRRRIEVEIPAVARDVVRLATSATSGGSATLVRLCGFV